MKEVKLTENQFKVIAQIQLEKRSLQAEFEKVSKREAESVLLIAESNGVELKPDTKVELKEQTLIFSTEEAPVKPEGKVKKLKKAE